MSVPPGPPPPGHRPNPPAPGAPRPPRTGVTVGRIVEVTVGTVGPTEVEVQLADGRTGVVPRAELDPPPAVGDRLEVALLARDDPKGRVVVSRSWARKQRAWEEVEAAHAERRPVRGRATKVVKGGVVVDVGLRGFLPLSLLSDTPDVDPATVVGTEVEALVVEVDRSKERIVLSRRDLLRRDRRRREKESMSSLAAGQVVGGRVVGVADHGAIVDLGGVRGLVHRSELSWHRVDEVGDVVAVGDEVQVLVLDVNRTKRRVSLSIRRTQDDPLAGVQVGDVAPAVVTRVVDYGAFARLPGGAEGLVHLSELTEVPGFRPDQLVSPGEEVMVKVTGVDRERRRLALSVTRVLYDG